MSNTSADQRIPLELAWRQLMAVLEPPHRAVLANCQPLMLHEGTFMVAAPNEFTRDRLENRLRRIARADRVVRLMMTVPGVGAIVALRERGLECPKDISIVGFDDIRLARAYQPPLTTIRQPKEAIGQKTVEIMLGILSDEPNRSASITLPHELIVRESTATNPKR